MAAQLDANGLPPLQTLPTPPPREPEPEPAPASATRPPKRWAEVIANPRFQALSSQEQEEARNQYFDEVVRPQIGADEVAEARKQFDASTKIGKLSGFAHDAKQTLDRAADVAGPVIDRGLQAAGKLKDDIAGEFSRLPENSTVKKVSSFLDETRPAQLARDGTGKHAHMDIALSGMQRLINDPELRLTPEQAAGVMGNLAHESGWFRHMQEINPVGGGRGGFGWAQWTGPRRRKFEAWTAQHGLDPRSDEANFGFLKHELLSTERRALGPLQASRDANTASDAFMDHFERPGVRATGSRRSNAAQILSAYQQGGGKPATAPANNLPEDLKAAAVKPAYVDTVRAKWDAAGPGERASMLADGGVLGRVARHVQKQYDDADAVMSLNAGLGGIGTRREDREDAYLGMGLDLPTARKRADEDLALGVPTKIERPRPSLAEQVESDWQRGVLNTQAMGAGLGAWAMDVVGQEDKARNLLADYQNLTQEASMYAPVVGDFANIGAGGAARVPEDVARYLTEAVVSNLPNFLPSLALGGLGGIAARKAAQGAVTGLVEKLGAARAAEFIAEKAAAGAQGFAKIGKTAEAIKAQGAAQLAQQGLQAALKDQAGKTALGAAAGAGAASVGMETGSIYGDIYDQTGQMRPGVAGTAGLAAGALDAIPAMRAATKLVGPEVTQQVAGTVMSRLGREAGIQFLSESGTEFLQTLIENGAVHVVDGKPLVGEQDIHEALNAALQGGIAGGVMGAATQGVSEARQAGELPARAQIGAALQDAVDKAKIQFWDAETQTDLTDDDLARLRMDPKRVGDPRQAPAALARQGVQAPAPEPAAEPAPASIIPAPWSASLDQPNTEPADAQERRRVAGTTRQDHRFDGRADALPEPDAARAGRGRGAGAELAGTAGTTGDAGVDAGGVLQRQPGADRPAGSAQENPAAPDLGKGDVKPFDSAQGPGEGEPSAFHREYDARVRASKAAGNTHLDELDPSVEGMRGKSIYSVHDPKVTGKVRTVDNRGNVYVDWSDQYSVDKEMAQATKENGKIFWRSSLGPTDLKDYVVGKPEAAPAKPEKSSPPKPAPAEKETREPETTTLKRGEVNAQRIKQLIGNRLGLHEFDVEDGGKVKAEIKVTTRNGEVQTKYLHVTTIHPNGAWRYFREQPDGTLKVIASGKDDAPELPARGQESTGTNWDELTPAEREGKAAKAGWRTQKGAVNAFGKKLALKAWADIPPDQQAKLQAVDSKTEAKNEQVQAAPGGADADTPALLAEAGGRQDQSAPAEKPEASAVQPEDGRVPPTARRPAAAVEAGGRDGQGAAAKGAVADADRLPEGVNRARVLDSEGKPVWEFRLGDKRTTQPLSAGMMPTEQSLSALGLTQPASGPPNWVEHVTAKGKTLRGIVRKDLTAQQAKQIDPFTFKKDGGFFIRDKHVLAEQRDGIEIQAKEFITPAVVKAFRAWQASGEDTYFGEDGRRSYSIEDSAVHDGLVEFGTTSTQGSPRSGGGQKVFQNRLFFRKSDLEAAAGQDKKPPAKPETKPTLTPQQAFDAGARAYQNGDRRQVPQEVYDAGHAVKWYSGWDRANLAPAAKAAAEAKPAAGSRDDTETDFGMKEGGTTEESSAVEKETKPIDRLDEPPHLNYWVRINNVINAADIMPPVGKRWTDDEQSGLTNWLKTAGFSVYRDGGHLHVVGDGARQIPDGSKLRKTAKANAATAALADKEAAAKSAREDEYANSPAAAWIEANMGADFANAYNKLMLARFLDGTDDFKGLASMHWQAPLQKLGFELNRSDTLDAALAFLKKTYQESQKPAATEESSATEPEARAVDGLPADFGVNNTLFTKERADRAREILRKKLSQLNSGFDPEIAAAGLELAGYYIEGGARDFAAYTKAMVAGLGEAVRPYLRSFYESARHYPGLDNTGMDTGEDIERALAKEASPGRKSAQQAQERWETMSPAQKAAWIKQHDITSVTPETPWDRIHSTLQGVFTTDVVDGKVPEAEAPLSPAPSPLRGEGNDALDRERLLQVADKLPPTLGDGLRELLKAPDGPALRKALTAFSGNLMNQFGPLSEVIDKVLESAPPSAIEKAITDKVPGAAGKLVVGYVGDKPAPDKSPNLTDTSTQPPTKRVVSKQAVEARDADRQTTGTTGGTGDAGSSPGSASGTGGEGPAGGVSGREGGGNRNTDRGTGEPRVSQGASVRSGTARAAATGDRNHAASAGASPANVPDVPRGNDYRIPVGGLTREGSWLDTARRNVEIVELVHRLEAEKRPATPEEQAQLVKFTGWGAADIRNQLFPAKAKSGRRYDPSVLSGSWKELGQRVAEVFTPEDWKTALRSTQYAHYTSETVVRAAWQGAERLGFAGGAILEPGAGIGHFAGLMPDGIYRNSRYLGIEQDGFTARIAQLLYPGQSVRHADYVRNKVPRAFFDLAIGNPPFASVAIVDDPEYARQKFPLHDYFCAKSMDRVRPGGLLIFVTSRFTLDKQGDKARRYLADRADLLGAIRLPNTAFKANAGTQVVTDVLFLRKRDPSAPSPFDSAQGTAQGPGKSWLGLGELKSIEGEAVPVNEYFARHPEMVLGQITTRGDTLNPGEAFTLNPLDDDLESRLAEAIQRLPQNVYSVAEPAASTTTTQKTAIEKDWNPKYRKEGGVYLSDAGELMRVENGVGVALAEQMKLSAKEKAWLTDYVPLRDALKQAQYDQLSEGNWQASLKALNKLYDAFVKQHGPIVAFTETETTKLDADGEEETIIRRRYKNDRMLKADIDGKSLVSALEKVTEDGAIVKAAILKDRVLKRPAEPKIETVDDALAVSLSQVGRFDLGHVARLAGMEPEQALQRLGDLVYEAPGGGHVLAEEYLSGDVRTKLDEAEAAAAIDRKFARNVEALSRVQPPSLVSSDVTVGLGATWVPMDYYQQYAQEVVGLASPTVTYHAHSNEFEIASNDRRQLSRSESAEWGTKYRSPLEVFDAAMNRRTVKVYVGAGTPNDPRKLDPEETKKVETLVRRMEENFSSWVWTDAERTGKLLDIYNDKFNRLAPRFFSGDHIQPPGLSLKYTLHPHQKRAIWRAIVTGNTYFAHAVGAGKTLEMIIAGMEQKRLGLIKKPMYVVPNHMLEQFAAEFLEAYPAANIMVADQDNFAADNRRRFIAQASLNNPDAIVITHSAFTILEMKPENQAAAFDDVIDDLRASLEELPDDFENKRTRSKIEAQLERIERAMSGSSSEKFTQRNKLNQLKEAREVIRQEMVGYETGEMGMGWSRSEKDAKLAKLRGMLATQDKAIAEQEPKARKEELNAERDKSVLFEDMGVDFLFVDEAHDFRKLDFSTKMNVKGLSPEGSVMALKLFVKTRWLEKQRKGRSFAFASGTPITNTMAELFSVQRFFQEDELRAKGLIHFDAWAANFARVKTEYERNATGVMEGVDRLSKFVNVADLMTMMRQHMDVLTSSELAHLVKLPTPVPGNAGKRNILVTPQVPELEAYMNGELSDRLEASRAWKPSKEEPSNPDPVIAIITDGRVAALDMRYIDPSLPNNPDSKLNRLADRIIERYRETANLTFTDPDTGEIEPVKGGTQIVFAGLGFGPGIGKSRGFDGRAWLNRRLKEAGIPSSEIAWIWDYPTPAAKQAMFKEMRQGKKRILIGSPKNMGTGVNVQKRLTHKIDLDSPWFPADMEQPDGRILRQGNQNEFVTLEGLATDGTYDSTMYSMVARKSAFIEQAFRGDRSLRVMDDISESSGYAMAAAIASGDPRYVQMATLESDVAKLESAKELHDRRQVALRRDISGFKRDVPILRKQVETAQRVAAALQGSYFYSGRFDAVVDGREFRNVKSTELGEAVATALDREMQKAMAAAERLALGDQRSGKAETIGPRHTQEVEQVIGKVGGKAELVLLVEADAARVKKDGKLSDEVHRTYRTFGTVQLRVAGELQHQPVDMWRDEQSLNRHENIGRAITGQLGELQYSAVAQAKKELDDTLEALEKAEKGFGTPFPQQAELVRAVTELANLRRELSAEGKEVPEAAVKASVLPDFSLIRPVQKGGEIRGNYLAAVYGLPNAAQDDAPKFSRRAGGKETITVDGKERPRLNSEGRPIHPTEEGIRNFWRWFGDSRVVDAEGRPVVVYHGTASDIERFDKEKTGKSTKARSADQVFWFSDNPELANDYAKNAKKKLGKAGARNIVPVYLKILDPEVANLQGKTSRTLDFSLGGLVQTARNGVRVATDWRVKPKDGVILKNFDDAVSAVSMPANHYAVFDPAQIKSAIGNTGEFSAGKDDINFSRDTLMAGGRDGDPVVQADDQAAAEALNAGMVRYFKDKRWENAYVQVELPDALSEFGQAVAAGFGRELVGVIGRTRGARAINGVNYQGKLFVNVNADVGFVQLGGHELLHQLKRDRPDLYRWFAARARNHVRDLPAYQAKLNALLKPGEDPYNRAAAEEELLGDFAGDALADPAFVEKLAKADPSRFKQLLNAVIRWLKQVGERLTGKGLGSSQYFKDVEALREHLATALVAYAQGGSAAVGKMQRAKFHTAWHGSPHDHDKFSTSKIGTGEGAQAFGWGLYFSNAKDIAEHYRDKLTAVQNAGTAKFYDRKGAEIKRPENLSNSKRGAMDALIVARGNYNSARESIQSKMEEYAQSNFMRSMIPALQKELKTLEEFEKRGVWVKLEAGKLYQVELTPAEDEYLDWHKPLSEQSEKVKAALQTVKDDKKATYTIKASGETIYELLGKAMDGDLTRKGRDKAASEYLHSLGIRGIRYPAEGQTGGKSGDRFNYVIFDENDVEITAKFSRGGQTIDVDGVQRLTTNSEGRPIHPTEAGLRNFWRWFGDSAVVDAEGRPLVVHHGSPDVRGIFAEGFKARSRGDVWFAAKDYAVANSYAIPERAFDFQNAEDQVIPLYLSLKNPFIVDAKGAFWRDTERHVDEAKQAGHDGIIIKNSVDFYNNPRGKGKTTTVYAWFNPAQAKSGVDGNLVSRIDRQPIPGATGNSGDFSPANNDIRFSRRTDLNTYPAEREGTGLELDPEAWADVDADTLFAAIDGAGKDGGGAWGRAGEAFDALSGRARRQVLGLLTVHQLVEQGGKVLPRMERYLDEMNRMDATRGRIIHEADAIAADWRKLDAKTKQRLAYVMHESTIAGVDGAVDYKPSIDVGAAKKRIKALYGLQRGAGGDKRIAQWQEEIRDLKAQLGFEEQREQEAGRILALYAALPEEAKAVYERSRDFHVDQSKRVEEALVAMIERAEMSGKRRAAAIQQLKKDFESQRVQAPYFPLARQGDYWVSVAPVTDEDGKVLEPAEFHTFQSYEQQSRFFEERGAEGRQVARGLKTENLQEVQGVSAGFVADTLDVIGQLGDTSPAVEDVRDQVYQLYLKSLPELSSRKHSIHRKKTKGFGDDALRAFAEKASHDAYAYARIQHGFELRQIMETLGEDLKAAGSAYQRGRMRERREWLEEFRDDVLNAGMGYQGVEGRMYDMDAKAAAVAQGAEGRRMTPGEQFVMDEAKKWRQFMQWMKNWASSGRGPNWVNEQLRDLSIREDTVKRISQRERGTEFAGQAYAELQQAYKHLMNPTTGRFAVAINSVGYLFHLAASPAAWVTNALQTPVISMPFVAARHGLGKTTKAFNRAFQDAMRDAWKMQTGKEHRFGIFESLTEEDEINAYTEALDRGLIERGRVMDLIGTAEEGARRSEASRRWALAMSFGFHDAERLNREMTFMAAYRLERDTGASFETAVNYAARVVNDTHFNYAAENRARFMRSDFARVITQFKSYAQHVTYLQWRAVSEALGQDATAEQKQEARRFLLASTAVQFAAAGAAGLPLNLWLGIAAAKSGAAAVKKYGLAGALAWTGLVIGAMVGLGGDDPDDPIDWGAEIRQALADAFGPTGGTLVSEGLFNALAGIDMSSRLSQRELWWRDIDAEVDDRQLPLEVLSQLLGAGVGTGLQILEGLRIASDGQTERGIEKMLPKMPKDMLQAARFADEGALSLKGDPLIESFTPWEISAKAAGFTPSRLASRYQENQANVTREKRIEERRADLTRDLAQAKIDAAKATRSGDTGKFDQAQKSWDQALAATRRYNEKQPRFPITGDTLGRSIQSRVRARAQAQNGIFLNRKIPKQYDYATED